MLYDYRLVRAENLFSFNWHSKRSLFGLLVLAFAIRLFGIDTPVAHWRQADSATMARHFHENGYALAFPQIDWGGPTGYVESEFPAYPFAVALIYRSIGFSERYGRLLSALMWILSLVFLYLLVSRLVDKNTALWAALYHGILPLNLYFGRAFMPEATLIACLVASVYFFSRWLVNESWLHFFSVCFFTSAAILLKLPSLYIGLPLLYLAWLKFGRRTLLKPEIWGFAVLVLVPPLIWYFHAHRIFAQYGTTFGIWDYGSGKWGNWSLVFSLDYWVQIVFQSMAHKHFALFGFPVFVFGLFLRRRTASERVFDVWLVAMLVYLIIAGRGNFVHEYYQLPLMLPAVVFAGKVHARFMTSPPYRTPASLALTACFIGAALVSLVRHNSELEDENRAAAELRETSTLLAAETDENDLILFLQPSHDPSLLYACDRRGWLAMPSELDEAFLLDKVRRGATYVFGTHESVEAMLAGFPQTAELGFYLEPSGSDENHILLKVDR